jgi:hypothetical protein
MNKDGSYEAEFKGGDSDGYECEFKLYVPEITRGNTKYKHTGWRPRFDPLQQVVAVYEPAGRLI